jgi:hypothetical protein
MEPETLSKAVATFLAANPPVGAALDAFGPLALALFFIAFAAWVYTRTAEAE